MIESNDAAEIPDEAEAPAILNRLRKGGLDLEAVRSAYLEGCDLQQIRPVVREAWERCKTYGIDPENLRRQRRDPAGLEQARSLNRELLHSAEPVLQSVHKAMGKEPHMVALADRDGVILRILASALTESTAAECNLFEGASWHERDIGCNGVGTALATVKPVILIGAEHLIRNYIGWTCIGVPVQDANGHLVGVLDLSVPNDHVHVHSWGWIVSAAGTIEDRLSTPQPAHGGDAKEHAGQVKDPFDAVHAAIDLLVGELSVAPTHAELLQGVRQQVTEAQGQLHATVQDLVRAQDRLAVINRHKDHFATILVHELGNPLLALKMCMDGVRRATDAKERDHFLQLMDKELTTIRRLLHDLRDATQIERGKFTLRKEAISIAEPLERACEVIRDRAAEKHQQLVTDLCTELLMVAGDPVRLEQIFVNVLSNAIKYTEAGGRIQVSLRHDESHAVVTVRDNGKGLSAQDLATIFDMFAQSDRENHGLGIGLALAHRLVQAHGGSLRASSDGEDQGSEFVVRLPLTMI